MRIWYPVAAFLEIYCTLKHSLYASINIHVKHVRINFSSKDFGLAQITEGSIIFKVNWSERSTSRDVTDVLLHYIILYSKTITI